MALPVDMNMIRPMPMIVSQFATSQEGAQALLQLWQDRIAQTHLVHFEAASALSHAHYWLGIPVAITTTVVGGTVFASLETSVSVWVKIAVGIISVIAAILASLQTFLRYAERAERHRTAAAKFIAIHREIEQMIALGVSLNVTTMDSVRGQIDKAVEGAPEIPNWVQHRLKNKGTDASLMSQGAAVSPTLPTP